MTTNQKTLGCRAIPPLIYRDLALFVMHTSFALLGLVTCLTLSPAWAETTETPPPIDQKSAFLEHLMQRMTLEEKIGQLRLISIGPDMPQPQILKEIAAGRIGGTFNSISRAENRPLQEAAALHSRLKIPIFFAFDVIHGHRTTFPISLGLASSWNLEAIQQAARVSAVEASGDGLDLTFAPMVDISRDPRWGRTSEGFGEDTYLVSRIAEAMVRGYQGSSPSNADSIMASVKHFALYGAVEGGRDYNVVDMSPMRMYQDYLPPYRAAIQAGAGGVMAALNSINGMPATANIWLMQDLLRKDWGFKGLVTSDHGAIWELIRHGVAQDGREAAKLAIKAGISMSMHDSLYRDELPKLIQSGEVSQKELDASVYEVLAAKYDMGLFHDPFRRIGEASGDQDPKSEQRLNREAARQIARQSLVLLKNEQNRLPLAKSSTIALIGPLADSPIDMLGSWSGAGRHQQTVTLRQGMQQALGAEAKLLYALGANLTGNQSIIDYLNRFNWAETEVNPDPRNAEQLLAEALEVAQKADVIVAAVGESRGMSHESSSRTQLTLPDTQKALLKALKATGKPLVLVLMNGRPLALEWEQENADAILETWFSGTEGGNAIADVLFGDYNPSGKLPISFPRSVGQIPTYYNRLRIGRPAPLDPKEPGNYTSQYFEEPNGPLYPFGHGLSYTQFQLSDMQLSSLEMTADQSLEARITLKNTGDRAGETVVQLYIRDEAASIVRPVKELKGFQKIQLQPGEQQVVRFPITEELLKFYNAQLEYKAEPGVFQVQIGLDSQQVQHQNFSLKP